MRYTDTDRNLVRETIPLIISRTLQTASDFFTCAVVNGYELKPFVENYLRSKTAEAFDLALTRYQWLGYDYIYDDFLEEMKDLNV